MRTVVIVGAAVWLGSLALITAHQVWCWQTDQTLWGHAVQVTPTKPRPLINDGAARFQAGDVVGADRDFVRASQLEVERCAIEPKECEDARAAVTRDRLSARQFLALLKYYPAIP